MLSNPEPLDPRVQRTRQLLEDSLVALLNEKKFQVITIQQITARAGVNRVTFYAHFEDKYDLYRHIVQKTFRHIMAQNVANFSAESRDYLRALVRAVCMFFAELNTACPPIDRQSRPLVEVQVQSLLNEALGQWLQKQGVVGERSPADLTTTAKMMSWAIFGIGLDWEQNSKVISVDEMTNEIFTVVVRLVGDR